MLHIVFGPMFAGKTTRLIDIASSYKGMDVYVFSPKKDTRYSDTHIVSHDGCRFPCIKVETIHDALEFLMNTDNSRQFTALFDEFQFFPEDEKAMHKIISLKNASSIVVGGLIGDHKCEKFGHLLDLLPMADTIEVLTSKCHVCRKPCLKTIRTSSFNSPQTCIGAQDIYAPSCPLHL